MMSSSPTLDTVLEGSRCLVPRPVQGWQYLLHLPHSRVVNSSILQVVKADFDDQESLRAAFDGADAVFGVTGMLLGCSPRVVQVIRLGECSLMCCFALPEWALPLSSASLPGGGISSSSSNH